MSSQVGIWNMAMGHLGKDSAIQSAGENSLEANACRRFWDLSRRSVLAGYDWSFARMFVELSQLSDTIPTDRWQYMYGIPDGCLAVRYIDDAAYSTRGQSDKTPFEIINLGSRKALLCDQDEVRVCYTANIEDVNMFDPLFEEALSLYLAGQTCMMVTRKMDMKQALISAARSMTDGAAAQNLNEQDYDADRETASVRSRL